MTRATDNGASRPETTPYARAFWAGVILASGIGLSTFFACATPFAALATIAALKLQRRDMVLVLTLVWIANQAVGYGLLGYPWTWDSAAWGAAIGIATLLAAITARGLSTTRPAPLAVSLPFVAAFTVFELGLYMAGFVLPGADGAFTTGIIWQVFAINAVALCGIFACHQAFLLAAYLVRTHSPAPAVAASFR